MNYEQAGRLIRAIEGDDEMAKQKKPDDWHEVWMLVWNTGSSPNNGRCVTADESVKGGTAYLAFPTKDEAERCRLAWGWAVRPIRIDTAKETTP